METIGWIVLAVIIVLIAAKLGEWGDKLLHRFRMLESRIEDLERRTGINSPR